MSTAQRKTAPLPTLAPLAPVNPLTAIWEAALAAPMTAPLLVACGGRDNLDAGIAAVMPVITATATAAIAAAVVGADRAGTRAAAITAAMPLLPAAIAAIARAAVASPMGCARATAGIQKAWIPDALLQESVDAALATGQGDKALEAFVAALAMGIGADAPLEPMVAADADLAAVTGRHHLLEAFVASNLRKAVVEMAATAA